MFALGLLILIAAAAVIFWPSEKESIGHAVTYSDGTTLTLKEVTYGTEHRYRGGGFRERIVSLLPRKLAARYASRRGVLTTDQPSVTFWFDRRGTPAMNGDLVLCDENGFGIVGDYRMMKLDPPNSTLEGWSFETWPRRQRTFTVRVYERGKRYGDATLLGEFTVRNPKPDHYPTWTASLLPLTASNGSLSVILFDLTAGVGHGSLKWKPALSPTVAETRAGFRIERNGRPTKEWGIATVEASDATGNLITRLWGTSSEPDAEFAELHPHLWPAESAWKLRVGLSQRSNFEPDELWTVRDIQLSPTNTVVLQTNLQGVLLQFIGQESRSWLRGNHHFNFRLVPPSADHRLTLIRALGDRGGQAGEAGSHESQRDWTFALDVSTNATRLVELTVALHRTRYFDFLARPQIIATNAVRPP
jgi:hypothetical protein